MFIGIVIYELGLYKVYNICMYRHFGIVFSIDIYNSQATGQISGFHDNMTLYQSIYFIYFDIMSHGGDSLEQFVFY